MFAQTLRYLGDYLGENRRAVLALQWGVTALYLVLQIGPLLAPASGLGAWRDLLFWGVWEPGVFLATLLLGPLWCGLLCPDGAMTDAASRIGLGRKPAPWMRPHALPLLLFAGVTFFSAVFDAHGAPLGALLVVGGPSLGAILTGLVYGRRKRVWCRHLCPVAGLFAILARCAPLHFAVDRAAWDAAPRPKKPVECPLLIDVRRMTTIEKCSLCGQCSGHRGAVALRWRAPGSEIAALRDEDLRPWDVLGVAFVLVGLTFAVAHAPEVASLWLRGAGVAGAAVLVGLATLGLCRLAAGDSLRGKKTMRLVYALIPLGGLGLVAGLLPQTAALLPARIVLTGAGALWSFSLGARAQPERKTLFAFACAALAALRMFWSWPI
jgi:polyferredoxin